MNVSALPNYPPPYLSDAHAPQPVRRPWMSPRQARVLVKLAWLVGIVGVLVWLRLAADRIQHPPPVAPVVPLDIEVVAERSDKIVTTPIEEIIALLGPPDVVHAHEPEFESHDRLVEAHPDRYPGERYWLQWTDPADEKRWVAIFVAGGRVHKVLRKGVRGDNVTKG